MRLSNKLMPFAMPKTILRSRRVETSAAPVRHLALRMNCWVPLIVQRGYKMRQGEPSMNVTAFTKGLRFWQKDYAAL